jgi:hypothetical protein
MTHTTTRTLLVAFCALPVIAFYWAVITMSVNVPFQDDFDGLLEPVLHFHTHSTSLSEFWKLMFTQDDERRIVVDRLIATGIYQFTGQLNLRWMVNAGALNLLVLLGVIAAWFKNSNTRWLLFVPMPWFLFTIQFYETIFWAMIPFQHLAVFVWAILTLWLLSRGGTTYTVLAFATAVLTIFADVTGSFVLVAGALLLASTQRWKAAVVWLLAIGALVFYYFYGLEIPDYRPKFSENVTDPFRLIGILLALFGLWSDPGPLFPQSFREVVAIAVGVSSLSLVVVLFMKDALPLLRRRKILPKNQAFLWGSICFIGAVLVVLATGRAAEGLESIFQPRYRHMYICWLIFLYLLAVQYRPNWFQSKRSITGILVGAMLFGVNAYVSYWGELDRYRKVFLADAYQWFHNRALPSSPIYLALRERVDTIYEGVYEEGIYLPEKYPFATLPSAPVNGVANIEMSVSHGSLNFAVHDLKRKWGKNDGAYLILRSPEGEIQILPAHHPQRPWHRLLLDGSYYYPGAEIDRYATQFLHSKVYDVEVGVIEGKNQYRLLTGKQLRL